MNNNNLGITENRKTLALVCNSDIFDFSNQTENNLLNTPTVRTFSNAVKGWKKENKIKSLKKYAGNPDNDLTSFYQTKNIGTYLTRRTVEVDSFGVPVLTHYEKKFYKGLSDGLSVHASAILKTIPFRSITCDPSIKTNMSFPQWETDFLKTLAKEKRKKTIAQLHPINLFPMSSCFDYVTSYLLRIKGLNFKQLKMDHPETYRGIHFFRFSSISTKLTKERKVLGEKAFIRYLEAGKLVKFDNHPHNIVIRQIIHNNHTFINIYCVDTVDLKNPKLKKVLIIDSWKKEYPELMEYRKTFPEHVSIETLLYVAQDEEFDSNCSLYVFNAADAIIKLLITRESEFHISLLKDHSISSSAVPFRDFLLFLAFAVLIYLANNNLDCLFLLSFSFIYNYLYSENNRLDYYSGNECNKTLNCNVHKIELQLALPQYFDLDSEGISLKSYKEKTINHIKDRWLIGNKIIEEFIKGNGGEDLFAF